MADSRFIGLGQGRTEDVILSFLRENPPPRASQNAFANQNVELKPRDLAYVMERAAAMAGAGAANVPAGAPGSYVHLSGVVQNVLVHIDTMMKPGTRELAEFGRAGGFEECLRLVHRDHPLLRLCEEIATRSGAADDRETSNVQTDLLAAQAGLVINHLLLGGPEFWQKIVSGDRTRTSKALLDALQAAWRPRAPWFPVTARMIGDLVNVCALVPTLPDEAFAIYDGPRLDLLLEILHTAVTVQPTARESSDSAMAFEPVAGDVPKGARPIGASRVNRTYVAVYCVALVRKILTSEHPDGLQHPGFVDRLRRLVPRMADDISALFGVLAGALEAGESGPVGIAKSIAGLAECTSAVTARAPELPAAEGLRNAAQAAGRRLAAAYPPAAQAFKTSWEHPYE
eukprot:tig00000204_g17725.t1